MSLTVPNQIRSIDPWSENRFSDNFNLRSRMLTGGRDVILFPDSFKLVRTGMYTFDIKAGIAVKDDVMIHILEDTSVDITQNQGLMLGSLSEPPLKDGETDFDIHIFIRYVYTRSQPPPEATFELIRSGVSGESVNDNYSSSRHLWLGRATVSDSEIEFVSEADVTVPEDPPITFRRFYLISPLSGYMQINCGVIREDENWYAQWDD